VGRGINVSKIKFKTVKITKYNKSMSRTLGKSNNIQLTVPIYKKYAKSFPQTWTDPITKLKPSDLTKPSLNLVADDYPMIIEFNNMQDNTSQVHSTVDIDKPLFQPSPKILLIEEYEPFTAIEKKIYFRNNDSVKNSFLKYYCLLLIYTYILGCSSYKSAETRFPVL
jgi:hypothetical protein